MITNNLVPTINELKSLLALAGLWWLLFWLYRDYRLDAFRQELFALRDRLFDLATKQSLGYDHPAYGSLRQTINGFIRFGHRLGLGQVILLALVSWTRRAKIAGDFDEYWNRVSSTLPEVVREQIDEIDRSLHKAVMKYLVLASPLLVILMASVIVPILLAVMWYFYMDRLIQRSARSLRLIDSVAMAYGRSVSPVVN